MKRGFKTWAENEAESTRRRLALPVFDRLPARRLLRHLGAIVTTPEQIPGISESDVAQLTRADPGAWSAITACCDGVCVIVVNDSHTRERQESSLHHEAAHLICAHTPSRIVKVAGLTLREYDETSEAEATWLAGCFHIPRRALVRVLRRGADEAMVGATFVASCEMVRYRRQVTGVDRQLGAGNGRGHQ
jgi:hypothetical protein